MLGFEPRALCIPGKHSPTKLHPHSSLPLECHLIVFSTFPPASSMRRDPSKVIFPLSISRTLTCLCHTLGCDSWLCSLLCPGLQSLLHLSFMLLTSVSSYQSCIETSVSGDKGNWSDQPYRYILTWQGSRSSGGHRGDNYPPSPWVE